MDKTNKSSNDKQMSDVDESQYSRQLHTFGADAQKALENTSVLISGLSGLGLEIAKCVIMTGVKSVTLHDTKFVSQIDLSSNYYAKQSDVNSVLRIDAVKSKLASLNPKVNVLTSTDSVLGEIHAKTHQVVVICDEIIQSQIELNNLFRQYGTKYILANSHALFGSVFCDFGDVFEVCDPDGETPATGIITNILNNNFITSEPHGLYPGDFVTLTINGTNNVQYDDEVEKVIDLTTFKTKSTSLNNELLSGSSFLQKKQHVIHNFKSLEESLKSPEFSLVMMEDFDRQRLLHDFMLEFGEFLKSEKRYPNIWSDDDYNLISKNIKCENESQTTVLKKLVYTSQGKMIEMDSIIAPIVAQEVMKAASKKYTPIKQWMYIDKTNMIVDEKLPENEYTDLPNDRYLGRYITLGKTLQNKLLDTTVFVVGAGAIGCEILKIAAMSGVNIIVTDMDTIEKSNLNRQFLFRNSDIGKSKSQAAMDEILQMNPQIKVTAQQNKVCGETLSVYNDGFFSNIDCVLTALDNIDARKFVDKLCLIHSKPMIDSGTLGTKGNNQVVIPNLTETYGQSRDPPEKEVPMCTLKNFPYQISHCIQWARDLFEGLFVRAPQDFNQYKLNPTKYKSLTEADRNQLTEVVSNVNFVKNNMACHIKECIQFAYKLWHEYFRDQIYHLTQKFPADSVTSEGLPFWAGTKKFPKVGNFTGTDIEIAFLESVSNLWAEVCGLNQKVTLKQLQTFIKKSTPPNMSNPSGVFAENEKQQKELENASGKPIDELIDSLPDLDEIKDITVKPLEFEKDDDTNFHVDFVTATSNSRAMNYGIEPADKFKTKGIAGKIIPAIITTTSLVSGLAMTEFIKVIQNFDKVELYSNSFVNLALPVIAFSDPIKIATIKVGNFKYTLWDKIIFDDMKVSDFVNVVLDMIKDPTLQVTSISSGPFQLFSLSHSTKRINERKNMLISDIYLQITNNQNDKYIPLEVIFEKNEEFEDEDPEFDCEVLECKIRKNIKN